MAHNCLKLNTEWYVAWWSKCFEQLHTVNRFLVMKTKHWKWRGCSQAIHYEGSHCYKRYQWNRYRFISPAWAGEPSWLFLEKEKWLMGMQYPCWWGALNVKLGTCLSISKEEKVWPFDNISISWAVLHFNFLGSICNLSFPGQLQLLPVLR